MSITFDAGGGESVVIARNPSYPLDWHPIRFNQIAIETADAGLAVYDNGPALIRGVIVLNGVLKSEGDALRHLLTDHLYYQLNSMTITPPANTNLGAGDGTALTTARYDGGNDLDGVFQLTGGGLYNINFPYRK